MYYDAVTLTSVSTVFVKLPLLVAILLASYALLLRISPALFTCTVKILHIGIVLIFAYMHVFVCMLVNLLIF